MHSGLIFPHRLRRSEPPACAFPRQIPRLDVGVGVPARVCLESQEALALRAKVTGTGEISVRRRVGHTVLAVRGFGHVHCACDRSLVAPIQFPGLPKSAFRTRRCDATGSEAPPRSWSLTLGRQGSGQRTTSGSPNEAKGRQQQGMAPTPLLSGRAKTATQRLLISVSLLKCQMFQA
jgi:hypothetical protein